MLITAPAALPADMSALTKAIVANQPTLRFDIEHIVPVALAHLKQLHPRVNAGVVDQYVQRPSTREVSVTIMAMSASRAAPGTLEPTINVA
jgi:hypothetical protein